jgi:hypothetical protein
LLQNLGRPMYELIDNAMSPVSARRRTALPFCDTQGTAG